MGSNNGIQFRLTGVPADFTVPSTMINSDSLMTDTIVIRCESEEMAKRVEMCLDIARQALAYRRAGGAPLDHRPRRS